MLVEESGHTVLHLVEEAPPCTSTLLLCRLLVLLLAAALLALLCHCLGLCACLPPPGLGVDLPRQPFRLRVGVHFLPLGNELIADSRTTIFNLRKFLNVRTVVWHICTIATPDRKVPNRLAAAYDRSMIRPRT